MKKYKLYLFDLDGTLLDSDPMLVETFHYLYKKYKPEGYVIDDKKITTFSGPQIRDTLKKEFPEQDQQLMLDEWRKESGKNYPIFTKLFPGTYEVKAVAGLASSTAESSSFEEVGISAFSSSLASISLPSLSSRPLNSGLSLASSFKS